VLIVCFCDFYDFAVKLAFKKCAEFRKFDSTKWQHPLHKGMKRVFLWTYPLCFYSLYNYLNFSLFFIFISHILTCFLLQAAYVLRIAQEAHDTDPCPAFYGKNEICLLQSLRSCPLRSSFFSNP